MNVKKNVASLLAICLIGLSMPFQSIAAITKPTEDEVNATGVSSDLTDIGYEKYASIECESYSTSRKSFRASDLLYYVSVDEDFSFGTLIAGRPRLGVFLENGELFLAETIEQIYSSDINTASGTVSTSWNAKITENGFDAFLSKFLSNESNGTSKGLYSETIKLVDTAGKEVVQSSITILSSSSVISSYNDNEPQAVFLDNIITKINEYVEYTGAFTEKDFRILDILVRYLGSGGQEVTVDLNDTHNYIVLHWFVFDGPLLVFAKDDSNSASSARKLVLFKDNATYDSYTDMTPLNDFINKNAFVFPSSCKTLTALASNIGGYNEKLNEAIKAEKEQDALDKKIANDKDFNNLPAVSKWQAVLLENYLDSSIVSKTVTLDDGSEFTFRLNEFSNYPIDDSKYLNLDALAVEERLRLRAFATLQNAYGAGNTLFEQFTYPAIIDAQDAEKYLTAGISVENAVINSNGKTFDTVREDAKKVITNYENELAQLSTNIDLITQYMEDLAIYEAARLYGIKYVGATSESTSEVMTELQESAFLSSIAPTSNMVAPSVTMLPYTYMPGPMLNMVQVLADGDSQDGNSSQEAYLTLQHLVYLAEYYATTLAGLTENIPETTGDVVDTDKLYTSDLIESLLADKDAMEDPENAYITGYEAVIKSYTGIAGAIEYLGIDSKTLSPQLQKVLEYANQLESFKNNKDVAYDNSTASSEPLNQFFNISSQQFSDDYNYGVELSATYIPLKTNLYDVSSVDLVQDIDWIRRFHYPFGFYRKALYIDEDVNSATNTYITDSRGQLKVCTLGDMLQPEKDIVLYLDDNLYNVDVIADSMGLQYDKLTNAEETVVDTSGSTVLDSINRWWEHITDTDIETIAKTGAPTKYSDNISRKVSEYNDEKEKGSEFVLTKDAIDDYLTVASKGAGTSVYNEYTPLQSYAVTSAVYRHKSLFNVLNNVAGNNNPVFVSSPNLAGVRGVGMSEWNSIYNYMMLKNLEDALNVSYKSVIDLDSPVFMDIYGNITTESGLVVIPAASNATLQKSSLYSLYTTGFVYLYNLGNYEMPITFNNSEEFMPKFFEKDEGTGNWVLKQARVDNIYIDLNNLAFSDTEVLNLIMELAKDRVRRQGCFYFNETVYRITEVLRGAPLENINYDFEGISIKQPLSMDGIIIAAKLEEIADSLVSIENGNSVLALPNVAFIEGAEYVIFFLLKVFAVLLFTLFFVKVYMDITSNQLGLKTIWSYAVSVVAFAVAAFAVPYLLDLSYYQVNKMLLQDEVSYIAMLNLEKESEGREVGLTSVDPYESKTELYLKVDDLTIPWYTIVDDIMLNSSIRTVAQAYEEEQSNSLMSGLPDMVERGNGLYIDINDIFEQTSIEFDPDTGLLYTVTYGTPYASFVTPYFAFLDQIVARVNDYNIKNGVSAYTPKVMSKGAVKTIGTIEPYFTSMEFWDYSQDLLGLKDAYGIETTYYEESIYDEDVLSKISPSVWYKGDAVTDDTEANLDKLQEGAKEFVVNNLGVLGRVSDETFIKVMALNLATQYNSIMKVGTASAIEIYDIDVRDLIRLSVANKDTVMLDAPKTFSKFVYDNTGTLGTISCIILVTCYFIAGVLKPICIFAIIGASVLSVVVRRLIKREDESSIEGFIITMAIVCGINILYSLILKMSLLVPEFGITSVTACIFQLVLQSLYLLCLVKVTEVVVFNWKDVGLTKYAQVVYRLGDGYYSNKATSLLAPFSKNSAGVRHSVFGRRKRINEAYTGRDILDRMHSADSTRLQSRGNRLRKVVKSVTGFRH